MFLGLIQANAVNARLGKLCFAGAIGQSLKNRWRRSQWHWFLMRLFEFFLHANVKFYDFRLLPVRHSFERVAVKNKSRLGKIRLKCQDAFGWSVATGERGDSVIVDIYMIE
jgi:hypothetical protein